MPPGWEQLLDYGTLGVLAVAAIYFLYHAIIYLFSRSDDHPGYVSQMIETHLENQRAQKSLYDALVKREDTQQALCKEHADQLAGVRMTIDKGAICARGLFREACAMARTVSRQEWPDSADAVDKHCREMERIIDEV